MAGVLHVDLTNSFAAVRWPVTFAEGYFRFDYTADDLPFTPNLVIPPAFWREVRQLHFTLKRGDYAAVTRFLNQWGDLKDEHTQPRDGVQGLSTSTLGIALEWLQTMTALWENTAIGKLGFAREVLGADPPSRDPWAAYIPAQGFLPFLSVFDASYEQGIYALPDDDGWLTRRVLRFITREITARTGGIPLTQDGETWYFQPRDWMDAAIVSFFLDRIAAHRLCKCGCGLPARPRSVYFDRRHAERYKKRRQNSKDPRECPLCGQPTAGEAARRVAHKKEKGRNN